MAFALQTPLYTPNLSLFTSIPQLLPPYRIIETLADQSAAEPAKKEWNREILQELKLAMTYQHMYKQSYDAPKPYLLHNKYSQVWGVGVKSFSLMHPK